MTTGLISTPSSVSYARRPFLIFKAKNKFKLWLDEAYPPKGEAEDKAEATGKKPPTKKKRTKKNLKRKRRTAPNNG